MKTVYLQKRNPVFRFISGWILVSFIFSSVIQSPVYAQTVFNLPAPGTMIPLTPAFMPVMMNGVKVHPDNPLLFDFIFDSGKSGLAIESPEFKTESEKLIKYFLAALTIKEDDLWVNLSPFEKDKIAPVDLSQTELGRDMLAQDYILKQLTASLFHPDQEPGKTFWAKVYTKAQEQFGTTEIPVDTFNKVWIIPEKAKVLERNNAAYITGAHLKVMLEEDYVALAEGGAESRAKSRDLSLSKNSIVDPSAATETKPNDAHSLAAQIVREVVIPEIEKEVNEGRNFAPLRQMFYCMILASWYKMSVKDALLNQVYSNQGKTDGVNVDDPASTQKIYDQYLEAYKKGVFDFIKEDTDSATQESIMRKYMSGGIVGPQGKDAYMKTTVAPGEQLAFATGEGGAAVSARIARQGDQEMKSVITPYFDPTQVYVGGQTLFYKEAVAQAIEEIEEELGGSSEGQAIVDLLDFVGPKSLLMTLASQEFPDIKQDSSRWIINEKSIDLLKEWLKVQRSALSQNEVISPEIRIGMKVFANGRSGTVESINFSKEKSPQSFVTIKWADGNTSDFDSDQVRDLFSARQKRLNELASKKNIYLPYLTDARKNAIGSSLEKDFGQDVKTRFDHLIDTIGLAETQEQWQQAIELAREILSHFEEQYKDAQTKTDPERHERRTVFDQASIYLKTFVSQFEVDLSGALPLFDSQAVQGQFATNYGSAARYSYPSVLIKVRNVEGLEETIKPLWRAFRDLATLYPNDVDVPEIGELHFTIASRQKDKSGVLLKDNLARLHLPFSDEENQFYIQEVSSRLNSVFSFSSKDLAGTLSRTAQGVVYWTIDNQSNFVQGINRGPRTALEGSDWNFRGPDGNFFRVSMSLFRIKNPNLDPGLLDEIDARVAAILEEFAPNGMLNLAGPFLAKAVEAGQGDYINWSTQNVQRIELPDPNMVATVISEDQARGFLQEILDPPTGRINSASPGVSLVNSAFVGFEMETNYRDAIFDVKENKFVPIRKAWESMHRAPMLYENNYFTYKRVMFVERKPDRNMTARLFDELPSFLSSLKFEDDLAAAQQKFADLLERIFQQDLEGTDVSVPSNEQFLAVVRSLQFFPEAWQDPHSLFLKDLETGAEIEIVGWSTEHEKFHVGRDLLRITGEDIPQSAVILLAAIEQELNQQYGWQRPGKDNNMLAQYIQLNMDPNEASSEVLRLLGEHLPKVQEDSRRADEGFAIKLADELRAYTFGLFKKSDIEGVKQAQAFLSSLLDEVLKLYPQQTTEGQSHFIVVFLRAFTREIYQIQTDAQQKVSVEILSGVSQWYPWEDQTRMDVVQRTMDNMESLLRGKTDRDAHMTAEQLQPAEEIGRLLSSAREILDQYDEASNGSKGLCDILTHLDKEVGAASPDWQNIQNYLLDNSTAIIINIHSLSRNGRSKDDESAPRATEFSNIFKDISTQVRLALQKGDDNMLSVAEADSTRIWNFVRTGYFNEGDARDSIPQGEYQFDYEFKSVGTSGLDQFRDEIIALPKARNVSSLVIFSTKTGLRVNTLDEALQGITAQGSVHFIQYKGGNSAIIVVHEGDAAMPGGIDFNKKNLQMDVAKEGEGIQMKFDPAMIADFTRGNFTGVVPVILNIVPISSPMPILGFVDELQPAEEVKISAGSV